jgi:hypothetical protein
MKMPFGKRIRFREGERNRSSKTPTQRGRISVTLVTDKMDKGGIRARAGVGRSQLVSGLGMPRIKPFQKRLPSTDAGEDRI